MKKQLYITAVILLIISIQSFAQIKFEPQLYANYGYENNIFRAPDVLELSDGTVLNEPDLIISDSYLDLGYDLYLKHKVKKRHIFRLNHDLWNRRYSSNASLNQFKANAKFNYEYKINRDMQVGIKYHFELVNKIGTTVLGDELTQLFSYKRNVAELYYKYDILKNTKLDLSASYNIKDYDTTFGVIPLDYDKLGFNFGLSQKRKLKTLTLRPSVDLRYSKKTFSNVIASDLNGSELIGYPLRVLKYYSGQLSLKGSFKGGFEFKPYVTYKIRDDIFEGYYSYNALRFGLGLGYKSDKLKINLSPEYQTLSYLTKTAPDPDLADDPFLGYNSLKIRFKSSFEIFKGLALSLEIRTKNRDSNTLDFAWKSRRSYNYYEAMGGIIIDPMAFF